MINSRFALPITHLYSLWLKKIQTQCVQMCKRTLGMVGIINQVLDSLDEEKISMKASWIYLVIKYFLFSSKTFFSQFYIPFLVLKK